MENKNLEMMKKIVEAKKQKSAEQGANLRPGKVIGQHRKAHKSGKPGGVFDK